jgi:hypothetical protein
VNVTMLLCLESAMVGGIRSCAPMLLFRPFGSGGSGVKLYSVFQLDEILVHGEVRGGEYIMLAGLKD